MKKKELIHVGTFGAPQGIKGAIKIKILTSSIDSFEKLKKYYFENDKSVLIFESLKKIGKNNIAFLKGCNDRDQAKNFQGKKIFSLRENFPKTKNNEYYVTDLINCKVFDLNKNFLGKIIDIKNFGAGDLLELINTNKKTFYIPQNKDNVVNIDIQRKEIIVNPILGLFD